MIELNEVERRCLIRLSEGLEPDILDRVTVAGLLARDAEARGKVAVSRETLVDLVDGVDVYWKTLPEGVAAIAEAEAALKEGE